jgi:hypothetical protein
MHWVNHFSTIRLNVTSVRTGMKVLSEMHIKVVTLYARLLSKSLTDKLPHEEFFDSQYPMMLYDMAPVRKSRH